MEGAKVADAVLADITREHWWAHVLANDGWWGKDAPHPPRLVIGREYHNLFAYMGEGTDHEQTYRHFGFTRWRELHTLGFYPEGTFTKVHEEEELRSAWLYECRWRDAGKPARTIRTVLEEVRPLGRP